MRANRKNEKPPIVRLGLHIRLSNLGFGYMMIMHNHTFVRVSEGLRKTDPQTQRIRFEIVSLATSLQPSVRATRPRYVWKWWSDELAKNQVCEIIQRYAEISFGEQDCTFVVNGEGQYMQASRKLAVHI